MLLPLPLPSTPLPLPCHYFPCTSGHVPLPQRSSMYHTGYGCPAWPWLHLPAVALPSLTHRAIPQPRPVFPFPSLPLAAACGQARVALSAAVSERAEWRRVAEAEGVRRVAAEDTADAERRHATELETACREVRSTAAGVRAGEQAQVALRGERMAGERR